MTDCAPRLRLENLLTRAVRGLYFCQGRAFGRGGQSSAAQRALRLYNRLYGPSNLRLLREDIAREKTDCAVMQEQHEADARRLGPLAPDLQLHLKNSKE